MLNRHHNETYQPNEDKAIQGFLQFISIPLDDLTQRFYKSGDSEDYLTFIKRFEASTTTEQEKLIPLIQDLQTSAGQNANLPPQAWVLLGHAYEYGIGIQKDEKLAIDSYKKGHQNGLFACGNMLLNKQKIVNKWWSVLNYHGYMNGSWISKLRKKVEQIKSKADDEKRIEQALEYLKQVHDSKLTAETHYLMGEAYRLKIKELERQYGYRYEDSPEFKEYKINMDPCFLEAKKQGCLRVNQDEIYSHRTSRDFEWYIQCNEYSDHIVTVLQNATQNGHIQACVELAWIMYNHGKPKRKGGYSYYNFSASEGDNSNYYLSATEYYWDVLAKLGNMEAIYQLSDKLLNGPEVPSEWHKSLQLKRIFAEYCFIQKDQVPMFGMERTKFHFSGTLKWGKDKDNIITQYHCLLGNHTAQLYFDENPDEAKQMAENFAKLFDQNKDAVIKLIEPGDIPALHRILDPERLAVVEERYFKKYIYNELRPVINGIIARGVDEIIFNLADIPHTLFCKGKRPLAIEEDAKLDSTSAPNKKARLE